MGGSRWVVTSTLPPSSYFDDVSPLGPPAAVVVLTFQAIGSSFSNLESKITDVGRTAVRIGEQLESLHQTRSTAQSTSLILSYYLSLVHQTSTTPDPNNPSASATPLEALFSTRTSRDGRARLAVILRRLMSVAKDVADNAATALSETEAAIAKEANGDGEPGGGKVLVRRKAEKEKAERVRDEVERYCEKFEKEVLRLFDRSYRKGDPRMMAVSCLCPSFCPLTETENEN